MRTKASQSSPSADGEKIEIRVFRGHAHRKTHRSDRKCASRASACGGLKPSRKKCLHFFGPRRGFPCGIFLCPYSRIKMLRICWQEVSAMIHTVLLGETLRGIAAMHGTGPDLLAAWNGTAEPLTGQELLVLHPQALHTVRRGRELAEPVCALWPAGAAPLQSRAAPAGAAARAGLPGARHAAAGAVRHDGAGMERSGAFLYM